MKIDKSTKYYNVVDYGAIGDGNADDTLAFIDCFTQTNKDKTNIYIPCGTYKITSELPPLYGGVTIKGEQSTLNPLNVLIQDYRNSDKYLISFTADNKTGGGVSNICFQYKGTNTQAKCFFLDVSVGWDALYDTVRFMNYPCAIFSNANDHKFTNCMFTHCGTMDDNSLNIQYAIVLSDASNEHRFSGCHIEHCRYILKVTGTAFLHYFTNCKFEMSTRGLTNELSSAIEINSTTMNTSVTFSECSFITLDLTTFEYYTHSLTSYNNIPAMIVKTSLPPMLILGCTFICGNGSGTNKVIQNTQAKFLNVIGTKIANCNFINPSYITPSIALSFSEIKNCTMYTQTIGKYTSFLLPSTNYIIDSNGKDVSIEDLMQYNNTSTYIPISKYYCNRILKSTGSFSMREDERTSTPTDYLTYVIEPTSAAGIIDTIDLFIKTNNTNRIRGKITLDVVTVGNINTLTLLDKTKLTNIRSELIYISLKNNKLYVQFVSATAGVNFAVSGLNRVECSCYVDHSIITLISNADIQINLLSAK